MSKVIKIFAIFFLVFTFTFIFNKSALADFCTGSATCGSFSLTPGTCQGCGPGCDNGTSCKSQSECPTGSCSGIGSKCDGPYSRGCTVVGNLTGQCQADCPSCAISSSCQYIVSVTPPPPPGGTNPPGGGSTCQGSCFDGSQGQNCGTYGQAGKSGSCPSGQICCGSTGIGPCGIDGHCGTWDPWGDVYPTNIAAGNAESAIPGHCANPLGNGVNYITSGFVCNAYCDGIKGTGCDLDNGWGTEAPYNIPGGWRLQIRLIDDTTGKIIINTIANQNSWPMGCDYGGDKSNPYSGFSSGFTIPPLPGSVKDGTQHSFHVEWLDPDTGQWLGPGHYEKSWPSNFKATCSGAAWWQVIGGDVSTNGDMYSYVPQPPVNNSGNPYMILPGTTFGAYPGVAIYGGQHDFIAAAANDPASVKKWSAQSTYLGKTYDSTYFNGLIPSNISYTVVNGNINNGTIQSNTNPAHGFLWFKANGNTTINSDLNLGDDKVILLVNGGDLTIKGKVNLTRGKGFFMTIVTGNINIDAGLDTNNNAVPALEGFYMSDKSILTGAGTKQLYVRGTLTALGGVVFQRDLGKTDNQTKPGELVEFAPDLLFSYPRELIKGPVSWREVAP